MGRGAFDEIAQDIVVLDLERGNPRVRNKLLLHARDYAAPFVAQLARGVEVSIVTGRDEAAIPHHQRRFGD